MTVQSWEYKTSKVHALLEFILLCRLLDCRPEALINTEISSTKVGNPSEIHRNLRQENELEVNESLTVKISELRRLKNFTQQQIADALEVSVHTVQNWERERTSSSKFIKLIKLCKILKCKPEDLLDKIPQIKVDKIEKLRQTKKEYEINRNRNLQEIQHDLQSNIETEFFEKDIVLNTKIEILE